MRALVTGASGLVGRQAVRRLGESGWDVVGLARATDAIDGADARLAIDIGTRAAAAEVVRLTAPCQLIVHTAASLSKEDFDPEIALVNCLGTQQVIELGRRWNTSRLVYVSSITAIGLPQELPIAEDHPAAPVSAYQASKLNGEHLVRIACKAGPSGVSLRLTAPIGPRMPPERIVSVFVRRALAGEPLTLVGRGTRRQNYVDVRDVAAAIELAARSDTEGIVNVGGHTISNRELAELCRRELGSDSPIELAGEDPEEGMAWDVSLRRAEEQLGYAPQFSLEDSVRQISESMAQPAAQRSATDS